MTITLIRAYLDSSLNCLNQVYDLLHAGKIENPIMLPAVMHNLGNTYFLQGNDEQALAYIQQALVLAEPVNLQSAVCQGITILGKIYTRQKKYSLAFSHFEKALPVAQQTSPQFTADNYEALTKWARVQENYSQAFAYQRQWITLKDSLYNIQKAEAAQKLALQYETKKRKPKLQHWNRKTSLNVNAIRCTRCLREWGCSFPGLYSTS